MDRTQWLQARQSGIGGTDVAAILGISKWRTPLDVYLSKVGEAVESEDNESMDWGRRLEPVIRQAYCDKVGTQVVVPSELMRSQEHPFMIANVDGLTSDRVLEIKTARSGADWGEPGTDEIPDYYLTQVQHYMTVTGKTLCDVAVLIGASDFRIYTVKNDPELASLIVNAEAEFWKLVEAHQQPEPRSLEECKAAFPISRPNAIEADGDIAKALKTLAQIETELATLKETESSIKAKVQAYMKDNDTLTVGGVTAVTWKSAKPRQTFDTKAFQTAHPDLYKQFIKEGAPSRRFLLKDYE